ncbi:MAG: hypothetical protein WCP55_20600 [Lentisphaerota bacterium]
MPLPIFDLVNDQSQNVKLIKTLYSNGLKSFSCRSALYYYGLKEKESIEETRINLARIAKFVPDARLVVAVHFNPSSEWRLANPEEVYISSGGEYASLPHIFKGHVKFTGCEDKTWMKSAQVSIFSEKENRAMSAALHNLLGELRKEKFYAHIDGVFMGKYVHGEWAVPHWYPDVSLAGKMVFSRFLREKYGSEDRLRKAWGQPSATFDACELPVRQSMSSRPTPMEASWPASSPGAPAQSLTRSIRAILSDFTR